MSEPSMFGITKPYWDMLNGLANWFAAAGSFAAAGVALFISNRAAKPSARVTVGHKIIITQGASKPYSEFVVFRIVNTGDRPIHVIQLGWKAALFRKRFAVQMFDSTHSSPLPTELTHGQEATWFVPLSTSEKPWLEHFAKGMLIPHYRTALWTLRAQFFTSVGFIFESRPEENLIRLLRAACKGVAKN